MKLIGNASENASAQAQQPKKLGSNRVWNLDIFRGICAFTVFLYHIMAHVRYSAFMRPGNFDYATFEFMWPIMQQLSTYAVIGFFVLSGFVITLYMQKLASENGSAITFLYYRFLRISLVCAPAVLLSVVLAYNYQTAHPGSPWPRYYNYDPGLIVASMTGFAREWNWPGWTLVIEWNFYFMAALVVALCRPTLPNLVAAAGCAAFLYLNPAVLENQTLSLSFFLGSFLTTVRAQAEGKAFPLAVFGILIIGWLLTKPELTVGYNNALLKIIPVSLLVLSFAVLTHQSGPLMQALHFLGKISFSLYVWHWPVILFGNYYIFKEPAAITYRHALFMITVYPVVVIIISYVSWLLFEKDYKLKWLTTLVRRVARHG